MSRLADGTLLVGLAGQWTIDPGLPSAEPVGKAIEEKPPARLAFATDQLKAWDTGLLAFVVDLQAICRERQLALDHSGLPEGVQRLLALATAVPERQDARRDAKPPPLLDQLGMRGIAIYAATGSAMAFLGEATLSFSRLLTRRANFRREDLVLYIQQTGVDALPIVSLISILIGMILAFVGSVQLKLFGAQVYVANLVGIAMVREMGAMMTAIIMAGRTGAAFAAQLGTMQVNEEIDALRTLGVPPTDFLVLPRMLALIVMMPLLALYADFLGIFGGYVVGVHMLHISPAQYLQQTLKWIHADDILLGIGKSVIFGIIIAICGCLAGIRSGRSAAAVGQAATSAVVTAIVWIIIADGLVAVITTVLNI